MMIVLAHILALIAAFLLMNTVGLLLQLLSAVVLGLVNAAAVSAGQRAGASVESAFFLGRVLYNVTLFVNFGISGLLQVLGGFAVFYLFDQSLTVTFLLLLVVLLAFNTLSWAKSPDNRLTGINLVVCFLGGILGIGAGAVVVNSYVAA